MNFSYFFWNNIHIYIYFLIIPIVYWIFFGKYWYFAQFNFSANRKKQSRENIFPRCNNIFQWSNLSFQFNFMNKATAYNFAIAYIICVLKVEMFRYSDESLIFENAKIFEKNRLSFSEKRRNNENVCIQQSLQRSKISYSVFILFYF